MAISPPSDIVLDVARAAAPADIEAARAALVKRAGGSTDTFSVDAVPTLQRAMPTKTGKVVWALVRPDPSQA